jgi:hypothetical protein
MIKNVFTVLIFFGLLLGENVHVSYYLIVPAGRKKQHRIKKGEVSLQYFKYSEICEVGHHYKLVTCQLEMVKSY